MLGFGGFVGGKDEVGRRCDTGDGMFGRSLFYTCQVDCGRREKGNEQVYDPVFWYGLRGRLVVMIPLKGHGGSDI